MGERIEKFKSALLSIQNRVCKLQQDLVSKEDYINYLEKEIIIRDKDLDPLRLEISNLKKQLEKTIQDSINQENYIDYLEKWLAFFQDEIDCFSRKLEKLYIENTKNLILPTEYNNNISGFEQELREGRDMDQQPGSPEHYLFLKIKPRSKIIEFGERLITLDNIFRVQLQ
jgi:chromosome segregation ATPase